MRSIVISVLIVVGCANSSEKGVFLFKEYFTIGTTEDFLLTEIRGSTKQQKPCSDLGKIWKYDNGRFFAHIENVIYVLDNKCQKIDSIQFQQNVLDFAVRSNTLIASTSNDEVEYVQSKLYAVNLDDKRVQMLNVPEEGVKFGLSLSENVNTLAFVYQDVFNATHTMRLYDLVTKVTTSIHEVSRASNSLGMINYPSRSYWIGNILYFGVNPHEIGQPWTLMQFDSKKGVKRKVMMLESIYSCVFRIARDQSGIVLMKRQQHAFKSVVMIDFASRKEEILYKCGQTSLSDFDDFVYLD